MNLSGGKGGRFCFLNLQKSLNLLYQSRWSNVNNEKEEVKQKENIYTRVIRIDLTQWLLASIFDFSKVHVNPQKLTHFLVIGSMKGMPAYIGLSFNPSRLVFSCCSACFFFVQRFSIQYHSVFTKYYCEYAYDTCERHNVPHERAESRRAYSRTYVHESGTMGEKKLDTSCNPNNACVHMVT